MPSKTLQFSWWLLRKTYPGIHIVMGCWQAIAMSTINRQNNPTFSYNGIYNRRDIYHCFTSVSCQLEAKRSNKN